MKTPWVLLGFWCLSVSLLRWISISLRSPSIFFFSLRASFLLRVSDSSELCKVSTILCWFLLACSISSSFSASLRSMSALIWLNSSLGPQDLTFLMFKRTLSVDENFLIKTTSFLFYHVWYYYMYNKLKYPVSNGNRNCTITQCTSASSRAAWIQIFPAPAAYEFSLVHECSFHSHQFVQWDQQSPLFNRQVNNG